MPWTFNPFSGTFDQKGSGGGGGASYIDGEVQNFSALPTATPPAIDAAYLVREAEGAWLLARKPAGIYIRVATTGTRATDWTYAGEFPDVFSDDKFVLYDETDSSKNLVFQLAGISSGQTRVLSVPNASGTIALGTLATGATDNAVLRADGTGGAQSQSSDLIVDDQVVAYAVTGDASTDIITAVGHNFTNNQSVRFQSLTGGAGLFSGGPASTTIYFVRDISGDTFRISATSGGAAFNFTTNITAGAIVAVQRSIAVRTRKQAFAMTASAANDTITATGHTFVDGDPVSFYNLVGGAGLDEVNRWFVRDAATDTFKVTSSLGGVARDITTNYTGGTVELEIPLILGVPRFSALILGDRPDGTIVGGNMRGFGAIDLQTNRNGANAIASGAFSFIGGGQNNMASSTQAVVIGGSGNTASGFQSAVIGGRSNTANADRSMAAGDGNTSSGTDSLAIGASNTASQAQSVALGNNSRADRRIFAHASGLFAANGDAQRIRAVLRCATTTNAAVEMALDGGTTYLTIPSGKVMYGEIYVVGVRAGGADVAIYRAVYAAKNIGGLSTEIFSSVTTDAATGTSLEIATVDQAGAATDYIRIRPTGTAGQNWRWVAKVDMVEVAHG